MFVSTGPDQGRLHPQVRHRPGRPLDQAVMVVAGTGRPRGLSAGGFPCHTHQIAPNVPELLKRRHGCGHSAVPHQLGQPFLCRLSLPGSGLPGILQRNAAPGAGKAFAQDPLSPGAAEGHSHLGIGHEKVRSSSASKHRCRASDGKKTRARWRALTAMVLLPELVRASQSTVKSWIERQNARSRLEAVVATTKQRAGAWGWFSPV